MSQLDVFDLFSVPTTFPTTKDIGTGDLRLDAGFFSQGRKDAENVLSQSQFENVTLSSIADVHRSGLRERAFVSADRGIPLITGSMLGLTNDADVKHVSRALTRNIESERLENGDVLVSCAGTVGKTEFVHGNHEGRLASEDVMRIRPQNGHPVPAYLYAYLRSPIGQELILSQPAGSVIVRVYEANIERIPVPRFDRDTETSIANLVISAFEQRYAARQLQLEAQELVRAANNLPKLKVRDPEDVNDGTIPQTTITNVSKVLRPDSATTELRLDAHFYNSAAQTAVENIAKCPEVTTIGEVTLEIRMSPLFVRKYVEKDQGVPYIAGKQISQVRPEFKYISRNATDDLDKHVLRTGWTLLTCAGSVGKVGYVSGPIVGAAAQDVMRVVPDKEKVDGGYLNAWLASDYGWILVERCRYGSVVDRVSPEQIGSVLLPIPPKRDQIVIGDKVREAYAKWNEALRLEDESQAILMKELTRVPGIKGI